MTATALSRSLPPATPCQSAPDGDLHLMVLSAMVAGTSVDPRITQMSETAGLVRTEPGVSRAVTMTPLGRAYWAERADADLKARAELESRYGGEITTAFAHARPVDVLALLDRVGAVFLPKDIVTFVAVAKEIGLEWRPQLDAFAPTESPAGVYLNASNAP